MKGIKKFFKTHKKASIIGVCAFFAIILIFFIIFFIVPAFGNNNYGDRLSDIDSHKIANSTVEDIEDTLKQHDGVTDVTYHQEGRILNFIIEFEDNANLDSAKTSAQEVIEKLSKKNLKYYDVQIFLNSKSEGFPTIGYHAKGADEITWGNRGENSES